MNNKLTPGISRGAAYGLIVSYLTAVLVGVGCLVYTNYAINSNNEKWCDVLAPLDKAYRSAPAQSEVGKKVRNAIHDRVIDFRC